LKLARAGYWGGSPELVLSGRVDLVLDAAAYENFLGEYEAVEYEMNLKES
jgi:hypothetical protein